MLNFWTGETPKFENAIIKKISFTKNPKLSKKLVILDGEYDIPQYSNQPMHRLGVKITGW